MSVTIPDVVKLGLPLPQALRDYDWLSTYSHEDGDLVEKFFVPALSCATLYQRVTGYFNAHALVLASRGLDRLIQNGGRMQLLVGCTLEEEEVDRIESGYALRTLISKGLHKRLVEAAQQEWSREKLGWLSWMVANQHMDVKVAVPKDAEGKFRAGLGLFHAKSGLLIDAAGDRLAFRGSINETNAAWTVNCESFDVSCSWRGQYDLERIEKTAADFQKLWSNTSVGAEVLDVPEAVKQKLLEFLPKDDTFVKPSFVAPLPMDDKEEIPEEAAPVEESPTEAAPEPVAAPAVDLEERRRTIWTLLRRASERPDGALVAVRTSTVQPWPHQMRAYKRMLDHWPFRLLIADEVGLGKTIEAGMIIRHAILSGLAKRVLILAPKSVLVQWQAELYEKFNLLVPQYDGQAFVWPTHHFQQVPSKVKVSRSKWTEQPVVLVSSHLMRRKERVQELIDSEDWDLLVLDEAHHARRRGAGSTQERGANQLLRLMHQIQHKAKALLLMTATPMQVHPVELWDLLALLGIPAAWDEGTFMSYFEALASNPDEQEFFRLAKLFQAAETHYGPIQESDMERIVGQFGLSKIQCSNVMKAARETKATIPFKRLTANERKALAAVLQSGSPVRHLMSRHTRGLLREYAKKGLLNSPIATRDVRDIAITMAPAERQLYESVETYIRETYAAAAPNKKTAVGFVMTVYRRRVASSFHALRKTLQNHLAHLDAHQAPDIDEGTMLENLSSDEYVDEVMSLEDAASMEAEALEAEKRESIAELLKQIAKLGTDSKALRLIQELETAMGEGYRGAIVFTQYGDTMDFLKEFLSERLDWCIGCYSGRGGERRSNTGTWVSCSKEDIKRLLRTGEIQLLVCTDAAGEGINLQASGMLVNFDLPWNPMKVEQRIGRIDRIGQRHEVVRIVNLGYANTVEVDVYFALSERINLFNGLVGKLQPILSRLPREFEATILEGTKGIEQARHAALERMNVMVDEAEAAAFDIDAVSDADLAAPEFPEPPYEPADVDAVVRREEFLPPGFECRPLDEGTYALRVPGEKEVARVTVAPEIFDEHFESHQLLLPGSPLFENVASQSGDNDENDDWRTVNKLSELL